MFRYLANPLLVRFLVWSIGIVMAFATILYLGGGYAQMVEALSDLM